MRNLNGADMDGRGLRVDHAEPEKRDMPGSGPTRHAMTAGPTATVGGPMAGRPLPTGINLPPGVDAADSITQTLGTMPAERLLDILGQMKSLVTTSPDQARGLLNSNPQLTYALFQAMILMKVVDQSVLQRMIQPAAPAAASVPIGASYGGVAPAPSLYGAAPSPYGGPSAYAAAPKPVAPPPPVAAAPAQPQLTPEQAAAQAQALQFALNATPQQMAALPEHQRNAIIQIRQIHANQQAGRR